MPRKRRGTKQKQKPLEEEKPVEENKTPTKREKIADLIDAAIEWHDMYMLPEDELDEEKYADVSENLAGSIDLLRKHTTRKQSTSEPHPGGIYYFIEIEGRKIQRVRCKLCGAELKPSGFSRHYDGEVCKKKREAILENEIEKPETTTENEDAEEDLLGDEE